MIYHLISRVIIKKLDTILEKKEKFKENLIPKFRKDIKHTQVKLSYPFLSTFQITENF